MNGVPRRNIELWAVRLQQISVLWYCCWLLLPAVQCLTRAVGGAAALLLFFVGVLLDTEWTKEHFAQLCIQALCMLLIPLCMKLFVHRGADFLGFYAEAVMFFFPVVYASHAIQRKNEQLTKGLKLVLTAVFCVTVCTTLGWLIQGMTRGGKIYAYSRSLGYAGDANAAAYLRELMLRNIGGYDFIYAAVAALPLTLLGIRRQSGIKRVGLIALCVLQTAMIVLSQYTYATLFAAVILWLELAGALIEVISKKRLSSGKAMLLPALLLLIAFLLRRPIVSLLAQVCVKLGFENFARSFEQLLAVLEGGAIGEDSRLAYYQIAVRGFLRSPLIGSMFGGEAAIGGHSDVLDLLSGMGILGSAAVCLLLWGCTRPLLKTVHAVEPNTRAHLRLSIAAVVITALLGTVIYSRDIPAITALGYLLIAERFSTLQTNQPPAAAEGTSSSSQNR